MLRQVQMPEVDWPCSAVQSAMASHLVLSMDRVREPISFEQILQYRPITASPFAEAHVATHCVSELAMSTLPSVFSVHVQVFVTASTWKVALQATTWFVSAVANVGMPAAHRPLSC